jgi:O-antigen/teichoic acid export membrane protein
MALKRVATDTLLFSLANVGGQILGMLLVPLYVQFIDPADYGKLDFLQVLFAIISLIVVAGLPSALFRFYHSMPEERRPILVHSGLVTILTLLWPACILLWLLAPWLNESFLQFPEATRFTRLLASTLALSMPAEYLSSLLMLQGKTRNFVTVKLTHTAVALVLNILLVAVVRMGITGLLVASLLALLPKLGLVLWFLRGSLSVRYDRELALRMLRFGAPLIVASISGWILSSSDRFFLKHYSTFEQIGLYSVAYKFASGLNFLLIAPIISAWTRTAFEKQASSDLPALFGRVTRVYLSVGLLAVVGSSLFIPEILVLLTNPKYYGAYVAYPLLVSAYVAFGLNRMFEIPLQLVDRSTLSGVLGAGALVFNLSFNILLIPRLGILGAGISTFLSYALNNITYHHFARRYNPMPFPLAKGLALAATGGVFILVGLHPAVGMGTWAKLPLLLAYSGLIAWWNREDWHHAAALWKMLRTRLARP